MNVIKSLIVIFLTAVSVYSLAANPKVIAHRGYWKTDGSAQNSIRSLIKADSIGCYATEFDVWITLDSVLVVNHDPDINGIVIEKSNSDIILKQQLLNGENLPTLENYLNKASQLPIRLVCELKTHNNRNLEEFAVGKILEAVDKYNLNEKVDHITFSKEAFKKFISLSPSSKVYYLEGDYIPSQISFEGGAGIDYPLKVLQLHPEWIEQCHQLGLLVNVWTVDKESDMKWCIDHNVDFITTNEPESLQELLANKR